MRGKLIPAAALATVVALVACQGPADIVATSAGDYDPAHPPVARPLQGAISVSDPSLFHWQGTYWLFSTGAGITRARSEDLVTFTAEPQVFATNPAWIGQSLPLTTDLWSPHVVAFAGKIHLYYAASTFGSAKSCIGHATTVDMDTPFVDQGPVICSNLTTVVDPFNAIDPAVFLEGPAATPWLVFGSYEQGIELIALDQTGARADTQMTTLAARPPSNPAIQAPFLFQWREYYYLFVSFDHCCNDATSPHTLRVGRSKALRGPYVDRDGQRMLDGGGTLLLESDSHFRAPGSNMVFAENGLRLNVYHAYDQTKNGAATLRITPLYFDNDGWPVAASP